MYIAWKHEPKLNSECGKHEIENWKFLCVAASEIAKDNLMVSEGISSVFLVTLTEFLIPKRNERKEKYSVPITAKAKKNARNKFIRGPADVYS